MDTTMHQQGGRVSANHTSSVHFCEWLSFHSCVNRSSATALAVLLGHSNDLVWCFSEQSLCFLWGTIVVGWLWMDLLKCPLIFSLQQVNSHLDTHSTDTNITLSPTSQLHPFPSANLPLCKRLANAMPSPNDNSAKFEQEPTNAIALSESGTSQWENSHAPQLPHWGHCKKPASCSWCPRWKTLWKLVLFPARNISFF